MDQLSSSRTGTLVSFLSRTAPIWPWLILLTAAASGYIWGASLRPPSPFHITFLDVGQGDAAVIRTPRGATMAVDTGRSGTQSDGGRAAVAPYLRSLGTNRLDALFLTHWDTDHSGGAASVLSDLSVGTLLVPVDGPWFERQNETELRVRQLARAKRIPVTGLQENQTISLQDGVRIRVLNPPSATDRFAPRTDNDGSLVLLVTYHRARFLLAGDVSAEAEHRIVRAHQDIQADVLKVSHHGSASGTSDRWLNAVRPRLAVISVGKRNPFGHPDPRVLARLQRRNITVLRTDQVGAVTITSDGRTCAVYPFRRAHQK